MNDINHHWIANFRSNTLRLFDLSLEFERSSKDFNAFCKKWTDSTLWSLSAAMIRTFLILPPSVTISAFNVFKCRDFSISIRSGMRSDRSSQHRDALNTNCPSLEYSPESTVTSSVSDGKDSSPGSSEVCCFSSLTLWTTFARSEALSVCKNWNNVKGSIRNPS
jgi:hypothetical protein